MAGPSSPSVSGRVLPVRLEGRALRLARTVWVVAGISLVLLTSVAAVRAVSDPGLVAIEPATGLLVTFGLSLRTVVVVALVMPLVVVIGICAVVFWRRSHDPMALLFTMTLLLFYVIGSRNLLAYDGIAVLRHSAAVVFAVMFVALAFVLALFPDGRFVPRSSRWLVPAMMVVVVLFPDALMLAEPILQGEPNVSRRALVMLSSSLAIIALGFLAQAYRYRRVSGATERQQAKWAVGPLGMLMTVMMVVVALPAAVPEAAQRWLGWVLLAILPLMIVVPIGVANAVLRYRLYEIDRIISRTVSYGLVVAVLGGVYGVGTVGLGAVTARVTGNESSDLVVAASVLAVAALFRPVRSRVQAAVDRRFNRTGFEAGLAVEALVHRLRDEIDLEALCREMVATAGVVSQPAHVSVWLAASNRLR